ncbi:MAG: hypothetical protein DRJ40_11480 [Thermoprotei archaeon]|nr:MAG: hypothetical protein DRJ40_11480 [Thermoprotei archaeon]
MEKKRVEFRVDEELLEEFDKKCIELGIMDRTTCIIEAMKGLLNRSQTIEYLDKRIASKMKQMTIYDIVKKALEKEAKELSYQQVVKDYYDRLNNIMKKIEQELLRLENARSSLRGIEDMDRYFETLNKIIDELHTIRSELQQLDQELHAIRIALSRKSSQRRSRRRRYEESEIIEG